MLIWEKPLSTTDAQQETEGSIVPYLRLTKGSLGAQNWQTWFRQTFFVNEAWGPSTFNGNPVERAAVDFEVFLSRTSLGQETMTVTYLPARADSHNAPSTWVHWSPQIRSRLEAGNFTGALVRLTSGGSAPYRLEIDP